MRTTRFHRAAAVAAGSLALALGTGAAQAAPARSAVQQRAQVAGFAATLALSVLEEAGKGAAGRAGDEAFGVVLNAIGLGDNGTGIALAQIQRALERVNTQLTTLRDEAAAIDRQVKQSDFNSAARDTLPILNAVDHVLAKLKTAASLSAGSAGQKTLAREVRTYIEANLLDKAPLLAKLVSGSGVASPTSLVAAAFHVRTADNFLGHDDSVQIRYLVDYYTVYEALAAAFVADYYRTVPDYPEAEISRLVAETKASVTRQLDSRRQSVSAGTVVDARTGLMWSIKLLGLSEHPGGVVATLFGTEHVFTPLLSLALPHETGGLKGWTMATREQLEGLIKGWNGRPDDWLAKNGGFPTPLEAGKPDVGTNPEFWTRTVNSHASLLAGLHICELPATYWVVNLATGESYPRQSSSPGKYVSCSPTPHAHGYIPVRVTPPGSYLP